jgi:glycosyltransferase involved in cell wall biosynthesis
VGGDLLGDIPAGTHVERAFALDTARHLAIGGRYPAALARPDRWRSWWLGAVPAGLALVRRMRPDALWSTFPIATAHVIGHTLARLTGLPWIGDFRDPMAQDGYPSDPLTWHSFRRIEERVVARASSLVFTTPGAQRLYRHRYHEQPESRFTLIENGFDEDVFDELGTIDATPLVPGRLTLLHSGIVYPSERDPSSLIAALATLARTSPNLAANLIVRFRAPVHDNMLRALAAKHGVANNVEIAPALPYREALGEMMRADALLVMQAANCNEQIPAKLYEYFRARRPILALTDHSGDTAATLRKAGFDSIAPLDDTAAIGELLRGFAVDPGGFRLRLPDASEIGVHSRLARAGELATLLDAARDTIHSPARP